jgi:hypothetical protein
VLLARTADALDAVHGHGHGVAQAVEDQAQRLHPQSDGGKHFARLVANVHALLDAILLAKVAIEVDLCLGDSLEI